MFIFQHFRGAFLNLRSRLTETKMLDDRYVEARSFFYHNIPTEFLNVLDTKIYLYVCTLALEVFFSN